MIVILFSDKSMGLYELKKELKIARQIGFPFNQINTLAASLYSSLSIISIGLYLKIRLTIGQ